MVIGQAGFDDLAVVYLHTQPGARLKDDISSTRSFCLLLKG